MPIIRGTLTITPPLTGHLVPKERDDDLQRMWTFTPTTVEPIYTDEDYDIDEYLQTILDLLPKGHSASGIFTFTACPAEGGEASGLVIIPPGTTRWSNVTTLTLDSIRETFLAGLSISSSFSNI